MEKLISKLQTYILYVIIFLLPITVLPIFPNPFVVGKIAILVFGISLLLLTFALKVILSGSLKISTSRFDLPVFLIAFSYFLSALLRTPNKMEALLLPGTATIFVTGSLLFFLINQLSEKEKKVAIQVLLFSGVSYSLISLLSFAGFWENIPQLPQVFRLRNFTPEGGYLPSAIFLLTLVPLAIGFIVEEKKLSGKAFFATSFSIIFLGLIISFYNIIPGKENAPKFSTYRVDWNIAVEALKESPILGIGPGYYLTSYNRFRPLSYNTNNLWVVKFLSARSIYLTALTEAGMLVMTGMIFLVLSVLRNTRSFFKKKVRQDQKLNFLVLFSSQSPLPLILLLILLILFPATLLLISLVFILLASSTPSYQTKLNLTSQEANNTSGSLSSKVPAFLMSLPILIVSIFVCFRAARIIYAEYTFNKAITALAQNNAQETYSLMQKAIRLNPKVDRYHLSYSQINLTFANSLARKSTVSDADRTVIAQLVQQAITEAKAAVALNNLRSGNWELLARTYSAIISLAKGADTFAIQSFRQAIALDPFNPNLRIALGGIHYRTGDFDNAIRALELSVLTKNDLANTHYNLAFAYREDKKFDQAINQMSLVLALVDKNSKDYEIVRKALEDIESQKKELSTQATENLTPPQPEEKTVLEPPLDLPESAEPPEAVITQTPTPQETAGQSSPTPSVKP